VHATPRPLTVDHLRDVVSLLEASDVAVLGRRDFTDDEVAADLRRADLETFGWYDEEGALVGYGWVARVDTTAKVQLDAYVRPGHDDRLGPGILAAMERRGVELAREAGHAEAVFDIGVYRGDERTRAWLAQRGFEAATLFARMRIDLDGPVEVPDPAPLAVRRSERSEADLRAAHRISEDAFTEHYGHVPTSFDSWLLRLTEQGPDWAEVWLAEVDGEAVGVLVGTQQFVPDDNAGYVRTLGTLPAARGLGAGKALLRAYFAASQAAGRQAVLLHVDVANVTGALRLYESVGMRPVLEIDAWTKRSPVDGGPAPAGAAPAPVRR
jgi:ribosomal protein S18 acetylase RimI-like enzyme